MLISLAAVFAAAGLVSGTTKLTVPDVIGVFTGSNTDSSARTIVNDIRLPRVVSAALLGGALSVSGFLLQSFFSNPIAGPYVLGISSGAKLTVALAMMLTMQHGIMMSSASMIGAAFAGSLLSMGAILLLSGKVKNMAQLIVAGVMIGYICSALTELTVTFADDANIVNLHNWSMGSFSGISMRDVRVIAVVVGIAVSAAFMLGAMPFPAGAETVLPSGYDAEHLNQQIDMMTGRRAIMEMAMRTSFSTDLFSRRRWVPTLRSAWRSSWQVRDALSEVTGRSTGFLRLLLSART